MLLANLKPEGYWDVKTFGDAATEVINSSFALLFLRQANLAEDLTSKLREDPTVLDRPVVKKEAPAEARTAAAPTPPPAPPEAKKDPEKTGLASLANPKGAAAPESVEKATAKPPPPMSPQQPAPGTPPIAAASPPASSTPPAARESNKLLLIGGGALGILLIGMRQNKGGIEEAESRRPRARKRPEAGNPKNGENRRPKTRKKEET